jgi:hypothetical protein
MARRTRSWIDVAADPGSRAGRAAVRASPGHRTPRAGTAVGAVRLGSGGTQRSYRGIRFRSGRRRLRRDGRGSPRVGGCRGQRGPASRRVKVSPRGGRRPNFGNACRHALHPSPSFGICRARRPHARAPHAPERAWPHLDARAPATDPSLNSSPPDLYLRPRSSWDPPQAIDERRGYASDHRTGRRWRGRIGHAA